MSSTPLDQIVEERREVLEVVVLESIADGVVTESESGRIAVAMIELRSVVSEISATVRMTRTMLHAGASSSWSQRKYHEHIRDMTGTSPTNEMSPDPRQRIEALIVPSGN